MNGVTTRVMAAAQSNQHKTRVHDIDHAMEWGFILPGSNIE